MIKLLRKSVLVLTVAILLFSCVTAFATTSAPEATLPAESAGQEVTEQVTQTATEAVTETATQEVTEAPSVENTEAVSKAPITQSQNPTKKTENKPAQVKWIPVIAILICALVLIIWIVILLCKISASKNK